MPQRCGGRHGHAEPSQRCVPYLPFLSTRPPPIGARLAGLVRMPALVRAHVLLRRRVEQGERWHAEVGGKAGEQGCCECHWRDTGREGASV